MATQNIWQPEDRGWRRGFAAAAQAEGRSALSPQRCRAVVICASGPELAITAPTLLIVGSADTVTGNLRVGRYLAEHIPGAEFETVKRNHGSERENGYDQNRV